jgi:hypothetical protein
MLCFLTLFTAEQKSDTLLKVGISIIDNKLCNELYEMDGVTRELKNGIVPSMMCAGELKGGKDTCQVSCSFKLIDKQASVKETCGRTGTGDAVTTTVWMH